MNLGCMHIQHTLSSLRELAQGTQDGVPGKHTRGRGGLEFRKTIRDAQCSLVVRSPMHLIWPMVFLKDVIYLPTWTCDFTANPRLKSSLGRPAGQGLHSYLAATVRT